MRSLQLREHLPETDVSCRLPPNPEPKTHRVRASSLWHWASGEPRTAETNSARALGLAPEPTRARGSAPDPRPQTPTSAPGAP
eukprot:8249952-Alexandrium_andersonii.AAC.1